DATHVATAQVRAVAQAAVDFKERFSAGDDCRVGKRSLLGGEGGLAASATALSGRLRGLRGGSLLRRRRWRGRLPLRREPARNTRHEKNGRKGQTVSRSHSTPRRGIPGSKKGHWQ